MEGNYRLNPGPVLYYVGVFVISYSKNLKNHSYFVINRRKIFFPV